jgi:hypothetical protein
MKKIPLTQGKVALVDDEDYPILSRFKWRVNIQLSRYGREYVAVMRRVFVFKEGKREIYDLSLENSILPQKINMFILFKNRNWLDFRKENLFYGTHSLSKHSSTKAENKSSMYKGVSLQQRSSPLHPWRASISIRVNGKRVTYRKNVKTEKEAGLWYNKMAKQLYGEFAYQNVIK